jgi:hypothetical protein
MTEAAEQQESQQLAGLLFIGSKSSSSQVLGWPRSASGQQQQQQQLACPVLQSAFLPSLAGGQAVVALQDPTGEAQHRTPGILVTKALWCSAVHVP